MPNIQNPSNPEIQKPKNQSKDHLFPTKTKQKNNASTDLEIQYPMGKQKTAFKDNMERT